jgi:hypothetical protein
MSEQRNMVIHFMDGTKTAFDFPIQVKDPSTLISHLENILDKPYLMIESDGAVLMYPVNNIKSVQVYPCPNKLPDFVIKGASAVNTY